MPLVLCLLAAQYGPELAGRKRFDRSQPSSEFGGRQTPVAVERAQKTLCRGFSFQCVAFCAGGNDVAVRIAAPPHLRYHMIEAAHPGGQPPQTIEAHAAFARMNGLPQRLRLQEIHLLEVARAGPPRRAARDSIRTDGTNLAGQPDLDDVAGFRAFDQAQSPLGHQAPHRQAHGPGREAVAARKPKNRKAQPQPVFQPAMPQQMRIDGALGECEAQPRHQNIFELFPDEDSIGFADFHDCDPVVVGAALRRHLRFAEESPTCHSERSEDRFLSARFLRGESAFRFR